MKNALILFYNWNVDEIGKINNDYYFTYLNNSYVICEYFRNINEADEIFNLNIEMINKGINTYQIILSKENNILFPFEDKYYILMKKPIIKNKIINYDDIISFNFIVDSNNYKKVDKSNWTYYWENKIDYIEYQFSQNINKYQIIKNSINYYLGIWENAISYYNDNITFVNKTKQISHKRISVDTDLFEYLNPLNLIVDYKERDIGEYIKSYIHTKNFTFSNIEKMIRVINNKNDAIILITRLLFPSSYFDLYENILLGNSDEKNLEEIINKKNNYEQVLSYLFKKYSKYNIPLIDWLIK